MPGKPIAEKGLLCPFFRKDVSKVCHRCELYVCVRGTSPQGGEIDRWGCSISWGPILTIENSQQQRQTAASVQSLRNEMVKRQDETNQTLQAIAATAPGGPTHMIAGRSGRAIEVYTRTGLPVNPADSVELLQLTHNGG